MAKELPPQEPPKLGKRVKNLAGAVGRVASAAVHRQPIKVRNAERDRRIAVCHSNVCGAYNRRSDQCNHCGCYIAEKAKYATEMCGEMEVAKEEDKGGKDWWTGETREGKPVPAPKAAKAPNATATEQVATDPKQLYVTGVMLLAREPELRMVLPSNGELVKKFNEYHQATAGGCTNCRRNSFIRAFELAIAHDFKKGGYDFIEKVRSMFPNSMYISAPSPTSWDIILKR